MTFAFGCGFITLKKDAVGDEDSYPYHSIEIPDERSSIPKKGIFAGFFRRKTPRDARSMSPSPEPTTKEELESRSTVGSDPN